MGSSAELADLENFVKDAILNNAIQDPVLERLVRLTLMETSGERYLFSSPLEEPYFYQRYFKRWVAEGVKEFQKLQDLETAHVQSLQQT